MIKKDLGDDALYNEALNKSEEAFKLLYDRYSGPLFRFIYRFAQTREGAEDILQDVFSEMLAGKYRAHSESNLKNWLFLVAKNKCLNFKQKASRENIEVREETLTDTNSPDAETLWLDQEFRQSLSKIENHLPDDLKATWNLRKMGFDYQQISSELSIPVGTVKSRFHRLVKHIKEEMGL